MWQEGVSAVLSADVGSRSAFRRLPCPTNLVFAGSPKSVCVQVCSGRAIAGASMVVSMVSCMVGVLMCSNTDLRTGGDALVDTDVVSMCVVHESLLRALGRYHPQINGFFSPTFHLLS